MPTTPEVWLDQFQANTQDVGSSGDDQYDSVTIQLTNGNLVVLWVDNSDSAPAGVNGLDIVAQVYDPLGNPLGNEFRANYSWNADDEFQFDAAPTENGFVVVYVDDQGGAAADYVIRASEWTVATDGTIGNSTNNTIASSPTAGDWVRFPTVTSDASGGYLVAWEHYDSAQTDYDIEARYTNADGTMNATYTMISGSSVSVGPLESATLSDGNFVVVGERRFGASTDNAVIHTRGNETGGLGSSYVNDTDSNGDTDYDASVTALTGGGFVVAYTNLDANDYDIEYEVFSNTGVSVSTGTVNGSASTDINFAPHLIALQDGGFVVVYDDDESGNTIALQRYDSGGTSVGARVDVDSSTSNYDASGVGLGDGRFVVSWTDGSGSNADVLTEIYDTRDAVNAPSVYSPDQWEVGTIGNDTFVSTSGTEFTHGWDGDDDISELGTTQEYYGDAGNDIIRVFSPINADLHDGGTGDDTIDWSGNVYETTGATLVLDLAAGTASTGGQTEVMTNFENLIGSDFDDSIIGTDGANDLFGGAGEDTIIGGFGADSIEGGDDGDSLSGDGQNDTIRGGGGNDTITGGGGQDSLFGDDGDDLFVLGANNIDDVDGGTGTDTLDASTHSEDIVVNVATGTWDGSGPAQSITSVEHIIGTGFGDSLTVGNIANITIEGGGGNDTILGGGGFQNLSGDGGDDSIDGGFYVSSAIGDILSGGAGNDTIIGADGADTVDGGDDNDSLTGNGGNDTLDGGLGNDTLEGGNGDDSLVGGDGDDSFIGGAGTDTFVGGTGTDTLDYGANVTGGTINMQAGTATFGGINETFSSIEHLISGSGNDDITVRSNAVIDAGEGNDTITDSFGSTPGETINGEAGNDLYRLEGSVFGAHFDGGTGTDTMDLSGFGPISDFDFFVDLASETWYHVFAGGPYVTVFDVISVENVVGSDYRDEIIGSDVANELDGGAGNDTVIGNGGADFILGGTGRDSLTGDGGSDTINAGGGADTVYGGIGADTLRGDDGDDVIYGGDGNDSITGGRQHDTIRGENGADTIIGGDGNDSLIGGGNTDSILGGDGNDTILGNLGNDTLQGGTGTDSITGGDGRDLIEGNTGNDTLIGNKADDTINGGGGSDSILGGDDDDSMIGQSGNDTIIGGNGDDYAEGNDLDDSLEGNAGMDTLLGGDGDDTINGGGDDDLIYGEDGNDLLLGAEGNDTIYGNGGDDTIDGGAGNDRLFGGLNADTFQFQAAFGNDSVQGFSAGTDTIEMIGYTSGDLTLSNSGGNTLVEISGQLDTIEIIGAVLTDFSDFVFS
ncbi:calcium-binding protein [Salipiger sp.]|uniref:calcium-binding protein n=1 Tax=Salipiger sp. TaxID=2078585 RepID=UPI003A96C9E7